MTEWRYSKADGQILFAYIHRKPYLCALLVRINNLIADILILTLLLIGGYLFSRKDILSPAVLVAFVWLFALLCYALLPHVLPPMGTKALMGVGLWAAGLVAGSLLMQSFSYSKRSMQIDKRIQEIYFWISLACIPLLAVFVIQALGTNLDASPAMRLRWAALGKGQVDGAVYSPFYYVLWLATYLLYLYDADRQHWVRAVIMGVLVLAFGIASMSKLLILNMGVMTLVVLYHKEVIRFRHLLTGAGVLAVVLLVFHAIRQSKSLNGEYTAFLMEQYVLRNFFAFETVQPCSAAHWGENVFRIFYAVTYKLGIGTVEPVNTLLPWISEPVNTNTYTCLYPFYKDFGYWGIALFAPVLGGLIGWVYKRKQQGDTFFTMLYAYFSTMLIIEFDAEMFFTCLAGNIKFVLLLMLPFLFGGYKKVTE